MEKKEDCGFEFRARQFANVEAFRAILGSLICSFFMGMMWVQVQTVQSLSRHSEIHSFDESDLIKEKDKISEGIAVIVLFLSVYFIVDLIISACLLKTLEDPDASYKVDLTMWVNLQSLLLATFIILTGLGTGLVWTYNENQCLLKRMAILFVILCAYKFYSFILAYSISGRQEKKFNDEPSEAHKEKELEAIQSKV